jgi:hypothetical protein
MTFNTRTFVHAAALAGVIASLTGCNTNKVSQDDPTGDSKRSGSARKHATAHGRKHQYYYYPDACAYRDCEVDQWFWMEAGQWKCGPSLPDNIMVEVEVPVAIELESDTPYAHHAIVVSSTSTSDGSFADDESQSAAAEGHSPAEQP